MTIRRSAVSAVIIFLTIAAGKISGEEIPGSKPDIWEENPSSSSKSSAEVRSVGWSPRYYQFFGQLDLWSRGKAFQKDEDAVKQFTNDVVSIGYDSAHGSMDVSNGMGFRLGVFVPSWIERLEWGGSVGYLSGPSYKAVVQGRDAVVGNGEYANRTKTHFYRFLWEAQKRIPTSKWFELRIRGGVGYARGRIEARDTHTGSFVSTLGFTPSAAYSNDWGGFTWELIPSAVFYGSWMNVEIGLGYAGLPAMKENDDFYEFKWTPMGLRLGLEFN